MTQIGFGASEAHKALDEFLNGGRSPNGNRIERWIAAEGDDSKPAAYIVDAAEFGRITSGYQSWLEAQEVADADTDLPPGYRPWRHSPLATTERLLPTEPLHEPLARIFYGVSYDGLPERRLGDPVDKDPEGAKRVKVDVAAISCLLRVTLDPDGQGAVPVMMIGHEPDEPGPGLRWHLAYVTKVPGLYVKVTGNGFIGEEWGIVTGSGWRLPTSWYAREDAEAAAEALGRTLPNTDWMRLTPDDFTPNAQKAVLAVLQKHRQFGIDEKQPEPDVMADPVPASDGFATA